MNIINKMISYIKNIFIKNKKVKQIEAPKGNLIIKQENKKENFIDSLKIGSTKQKLKKEIEIPICEGDGLGIKKEMTY